MIEFEQVTKWYEASDTPVFDHFSTVIQKGEFVLLTGDNGTGKTTFIKLLLKETEVNSGRIWVLDQDISAMLPREIPYYRRKLGVVFQEFYLVQDKTVYENVELARMIIGGRKKGNRTVITSLFSLLGITHLFKKYPSELSGGEQQKVCLARALVNYPSILLADEPTGNLSSKEARELMKLFDLVHRQGITVIVATHNKSSAQGLEYREIILGGDAENGQDAGAETTGQ